MGKLIGSVVIVIIVIHTKVTRSQGLDVITSDTLGVIRNSEKLISSQLLRALQIVNLEHHIPIPIISLACQTLLPKERERVW